MAEPTIDERVQAGAAWLDENVPGWVEKIDVRVLDISSCFDCVLGQTFGNFFKSPWRARWDALVLEDAKWVVADRGFGGEVGEVDLLNEAWKQLVVSRRAVTV